jgi:hypothetical protein
MLAFVFHKHIDYTSILMCNQEESAIFLLMYNNIVLSWFTRNGIGVSLVFNGSMAISQCKYGLMGLQMMPETKPWIPLVIYSDPLLTLGTNPNLIS